MAAGFFRKLLENADINNFDVRSSGIMTVNGLLATPESSQMLEPYEADLSRHRSKPITAELLRGCDLILGMTPIHVQQALRLEPGIRDKIFLLKEYTQNDPKKVQIDDPMGNTLEVYKKVFGEIRSACQRLLKTAFVGGAAEKKQERAAEKKSAKKAAKKVAKETAKASKKTAKKAAAKKTNKARKKGRKSK